MANTHKKCISKEKAGCEAIHIQSHVLKQKLKGKSAIYLSGGIRLLCFSLVLCFSVFEHCSMWWGEHKNERIVGNNHLLKEFEARYDRLTIHFRISSSHPLGNWKVEGNVFKSN